MYLYDDVAYMIDENNIDFIIDNLCPTNELIFAEETNADGNICTYHIKYTNEIKNIDTYKLDMESGSVIESEIGFIVINKHIYVIFKQWDTVISDGALKIPLDNELWE